MLKLFFGKQRQVEALISRYLDELKGVQENFTQAVDARMGDRTPERFEFLAEQTHLFESRADDVREEIKTLMYGKTLIPESRGDVLGLLETIDQIPRYFEVILNIMKTQRLFIPAFLIPDVRELIQISMESCDLVILQVEDLFRRSERIRELVSVIDQKESQCDHIERRIITTIFESDLDPFLKLQLKELVVCMGDISDQADRVSKRIHIVSLKRRV